MVSTSIHVGGHNASHSRGKHDRSSTTVLPLLALSHGWQIIESGFLLGWVIWEVASWSGVRCWPIREEPILWLKRPGALWVSDSEGNSFPGSDPESLSVAWVWDVYWKWSTQGRRGLLVDVVFRALSSWSPNDRHGEGPQGESGRRGHSH